MTAALTMHPEHVEAFVLQLRSIETRSWATRHRGPTLLHSSQRDPDCAAARREPWCRAAMSAIPHGDPLQRGVIRASAVLADVLPILDLVGSRDAIVAGLPHIWVDEANGRLMLWSGDVDRTPIWDDVTAQRRFGDFRPGGYGWVFEDVKATTERCPACWGTRRIDRRIPGVPASVCVASSPCPVCWPRRPDGELKFWDDGTAGRCAPVPARGRQGLWDWTPTNGRTP